MSVVNSRKVMIDQVSKRLQIALTDYHYSLANKPMNEQQFIKFCNKISSEVVSIVRDHDKATAVGKELSSLTPSSADLADNGKD